jgi:hypothetical protein
VRRTQCLLDSVIGDGRVSRELLITFAAPNLTVRRNRGVTGAKRDSHAI